MTTFCWFPPEKGARRQQRLRRPHVVLGDLPSGVGGDQFPVDRATPLEVVLPAEDEVVGDGVVEDQATVQAVFGDVREPGVRPVTHGEVRHVAARERDAARGDAPQSRDRLDELGLPVSFDSRDSENLARGDGDGDVVDRLPSVALDSQVVHDQGAWGLGPGA